MTSTGSSPAPAGPVGLATSFRSVPDLWHHRVGSTPDAEAMRYRSQGRWRTLTWADAGTRVRALTNALLAQGIAPEQRCVVLAETTVEWILADLAILCAGAATTTVYPRSSDGELEYIIADSGAVVVFTEELVKLTVPPTSKVVALAEKEALSAEVQGSRQPSEPSRLERTFSMCQCIRSACPWVNME